VDTTFGDLGRALAASIPPDNCGVECTKLCSRGVHQCDGKHLCTSVCSPCTREVVWELPRGHQLTKSCWELDIDVLTYKSKARCQKIQPDCQHRCTRACSEECGVCQVRHFIYAYEGCANLVWLRMGRYAPKTMI